MSDVVIVGAKRTAIGSFLGQFTGVRRRSSAPPPSPARSNMPASPPDQVDEVIMGCVLPAGLGQAPARQASLGAGLPPSAGCTTINKVCGSGMKAIMLAHDAIKAGSSSIVVAGGMESMTNAPHLLNNSRTGIRYGGTEMLDHLAWDGLTSPYDKQAMGVFGDMACNKYGFDRAALDAYSEESVKRAQAAITSGAFKDEIVPVTVKGRKGDVVVDTDEEPGKIDPSKIPTLRAAFGKDGVIYRGVFVEDLRRRRRHGADVGGRSRQARAQAAGARRRPCHPFAGTGMVHHRARHRHRQRPGEGGLERRRRRPVRGQRSLCVRRHGTR